MADAIEEEYILEKKESWRPQWGLYRERLRPIRELAFFQWGSVITVVLLAAWAGGPFGFKPGLRIGLSVMLLVVGLGIHFTGVALNEPLILMLVPVIHVLPTLPLFGLHTSGIPSIGPWVVLMIAYLELAQAEIRFHPLVAQLHLESTREDQKDEILALLARWRKHLPFQMVVLGGLLFLLLGIQRVFVSFGPARWADSLFIGGVYGEALLGLGTLGIIWIGFLIWDFFRRERPSSTADGELD